MSHQRPSFPKANTFSLSLLLLPSWNFLHFQAVRSFLRVKLRTVYMKNCLISALNPNTVALARLRYSTDHSSVVLTRLETLHHEWEEENVRTQ